MKKVKFILFFPLLFFHVAGQDSSSAEKKKLQWQGYIKDLQSFVFNKDFSTLNYTHLIHNRINLKWMPSGKITAAAELRNRFYWGDEVKMVPHFGRLLRNENEAVNLSSIWYISHNAILHSNVERLWFEYRKPQWNIRAGRQRVNWGMANTWNPNDIFNTYNFLDFDYEERPGSDALKFQYIIRDFSNIEFAIASSGEKDKIIAAAKYFTNYKGYDLQLISGIYHNLFTAGAGWAGSIGNAGYKGESQFYFNKKDSGTYFNITMEADYVFKKGWYVSIAYLYNRNGSHAPFTDWAEANFKISPLNLMPSRWNILIITSKEFTPLFSGGISLVYSPEVNMLIVFPSFRYNLATDLDVDLIWQSFFAELQHKFQGVAHTGFLRFKKSF